MVGWLDKYMNEQVQVFIITWPAYLYCIVLTSALLQVRIYMLFAYLYVLCYCADLPNEILLYFEHCDSVSGIIKRKYMIVQDVEQIQYKTVKWMKYNFTSLGTGQKIKPRWKAPMLQTP